MKFRKLEALAPQVALNLLIFVLGYLWTCVRLLILTISKEYECARPNEYYTEKDYTIL